MGSSIAEFGTFHQCLIAAEEFMELAHALLKINRLDVEIDMQEHIEHVHDEIADALVVLGQLVTIFDPHQLEVQARTEFKMNRLEHRINASIATRNTLDKIDPNAIHIDNKKNLDELIQSEVQQFWAIREKMNQLK